MSVAALDGAIDIASARQILTKILEQAGKDTPALDARLLIGHALKLDHTALASDPGRALSPQERLAIMRLAERRMAGEPVSRILGTREFWGLPLALSKAVLVPRPETEILIEAALDVLGERRNEPLCILDLGTGTGALLLALLQELRNASGIGIDLDGEAVDTAKANAQTLGLSNRAQFLCADFSVKLGPPPVSPFDLVVSNPPYIPTQDIAALDVEVREHDPKLALDGGEDGLDAYRAIASQLPSLLAADGIAVLEIGIGQQADVETIFRQQGFVLKATKPDLSGIARALVFTRR